MVISKNYKNTEEQIKDRNNHLRIMMDFLRTKKNPNILELGVERGASTTAFNLISEEIDGMVYSVDIEDCKDVVISPNWNFLQSNDLDYEFILKTFPKLEIEGIDLIYIDSYHENHHVLKLLNIWFKYLKFGFWRSTDQTCYDIWNNRLSRKEAISIVNELSDQFPEEYFQDFLRFHNISETEFWEIAEKYRNKDIWEFSGNNWNLKYPLKDI